MDLLDFELELIYINWITVSTRYKWNTLYGTGKH